MASDPNVDAQSGSGKTYTMLGPDAVVDVIKKGVLDTDQAVPSEVQNQYGIIPRAIFDVFSEINRLVELQQSSSFEIKINYFEIYQESFNDLLATNPSQSQNLKLREQKDGQLIVVGANVFTVGCPDDVFELLMVG